MRLEVDESLEGIRWEGVRACDAFEGGGCEWNPPEGRVDVCEAWGLGGGAEAVSAQEAFRDRQLRHCQRLRSVDRAAMFGAKTRGEDGGWDAEDRFLLDAAGITASHVSDDLRR